MDPEIKRRAEGALARADAAIFEAHATRDQYAPYMDAARAIAMPYGIELEPIDSARAQLDRAVARDALGIPQDAQLLLCVGTVEPRKAQVSLVQAFRRVAERHPDARLALVGARDDDYSPRVQEFIAAGPHADRVHFVGVVDREVWSWYGAADFLVCASDVESLPRTVLEAMAFELPIIATDIYGLPEIVEHGVNGWLLPPCDMHALADTIELALGTTEEERREMGRASRQVVEQDHQFGPYAERVADLLEQLAAGRWPPMVDARAE
jgi:glycosyltransferase involved in cell wall biosynthesis